MSHAHPEWFIPDDGVGVHLTAAGQPLRSPAGSSASSTPSRVSASRRRRRSTAAPSVAIGTRRSAPGADVHRHVGRRLPASPAPRRAAFSTPAPAAPSVPAAPSSCRSAGRDGVPDGTRRGRAERHRRRPVRRRVPHRLPVRRRPPLASNVDYVAHEARPNLVVARLSPGGRVCIYSMVQTDVDRRPDGLVQARGGDAAVAARPEPPARHPPDRRASPAVTRSA